MRKVFTPATAIWLTACCVPAILDGFAGGELAGVARNCVKSPDTRITRCASGCTAPRSLGLRAGSESLHDYCASKTT
eukprot:6180919-Pleurochrysis_carterae.AAC.3